MFKLFSYALVMALIVGCASNKSGYKTEVEVESKLYSMNRTEVMMDLPPPTSKTDLGNGQESWMWQSEVGGLTGGECTLLVVFHGAKVVNVKLSANDLSWVAYPLGSCTKIIQTLRR